MFFKAFKTLFLTVFAIATIFLIQTEHVRAASTTVNVTANICSGSGSPGSPLANMTATLTNGTTVFSCVTVSGRCSIINVPTGVSYNVTVSPPSGYNITTPATIFCGAPPATLLPTGVSLIAVSLTPSAGGTTGDTTGGGTTGTTGGIPGLTTKPLATIINDITIWLLSIVALIAVLFIMIGGVYYMTSGGDERRIETAKSIITYAILGLFVAAIAYAAVLLVNKLVGT